MKNLIQSLTLLLSVFLTQIVNSQSWDYNGNPSTGQYIGTNSAQPFPIYTDGDERMRVDADGNVGIGTTSPLNLLDLNSSSASNVFQRFSNSVTGDYYNQGFEVGIDNTGNAILRQNYSSGNMLFTLGTSSRGIRISNGFPSGYVGIGDLDYFTSQSLLHLHRETYTVYSQITSTVTGYASTDGLRIGVNPDIAWAYDPIAEIRQQENTAMTLFTNSAERIRIMHTGALNNGVAFDLAGVANNLTRIGISHNPSTPVTRPLSLLHLGYNTANATTNDGWRSWMDVGIFASQSSDNVYLGMKPEETGSDAVLSWGDNSYTDASGPDNFRVIFTNPYNASTPGLYASGANGLEAMRMTPTLTAVNTGIGGDPTTNQYYGGSANPSATLEVNSWGATNVAGGSSGLRFTNLNSSSPKIANPGTGILTVDAEGDVIYVPCCSSGSISVCGSPTSGFIPRWCGLGSNITNSIIYDDSTKVGIGTSAPANTLEINQGASGNSGLRFTQLTSSATPASNPGSGLLAVDSTGDVIYVAANNAPSIGNYCGSAPSPITGNFEVPLNNNNYYFTGHGTNPDSNFIGSSVAIGLPCGNAIPLAKLHVLQSASNPNEDSTSAAGIFENDAAGSVTVGVFGTSYGEAEKNYGGIFHATSTHTNAAQSTCGVWGSAINGMDENRGVFGDASGGDHNFGVYGIAGLGTTNYAVFGTLEDTSAIGSGDWAGYFNGPVFSSHGYTTSDVKLKTNIKDLGNNNALALINSLQPKSYEYKNASYPSMQLPKGNQYGLIAQEVETVLPQLVKEAIHPPKRDKQGKIIHPQVEYLAVNYTGFIPVLIGAVKEQQHTIDSLKDVINDRLSSLEKRLNGCCNANNYKTDPNDANTEGSNRHTVELSNLQSIILDQNAPNPFAEQTVIGYFLPDDVKTAEIIFHNAQGRQINRAAITTRGKGEINVYAQDLSSGVYTYTLIADGNVIDTKRMVKK